jgi:uncharacterized membrane-anchored protein
MGVGLAGLAARALAHGAAGDWDEYVLLLLAPVVIAAVLWVTRRTDHDADDDQEAHRE